MVQRHLIFLMLFLSAFYSLATTNNAGDVSGLLNAAQKWAQENLDADFLKSLQETDAGTFNRVTDWLNAETQTTTQIQNLEAEIRASEQKLKEKRQALSVVQNQIALLKLTPKQLAAVSEYNRSVIPPKHEAGFIEWLTTWETWYEIGKDVAISTAFLLIGIWIEHERQKRKPKKPVSSPGKRSKSSHAT